MQLTYSSLAFALLTAVAAAPDADPAALLEERDPQGPRSSLTGGSPSSTASLTAGESGVSLVGIETGRFTVASGGGVYGVTSTASEYIVAGHTLTAGGGDALVGGVRVSAASDGFVADGVTVGFAAVTVTTSSSAGSSVLVPGQETTSAAVTVTPCAGVTVTACAASSGSSSGGAVAMVTGAPVVKVAGAVFGGVAGLLLF